MEHIATALLAGFRIRLMLHSPLPRSRDLVLGLGNFAVPTPLALYRPPTLTGSAA